MEQDLNLYLDLEPGEFADLEVVARASLAFASAVREIAFVVDPSIVISLELESSTKGSLSINSVVRFIKQQVADPVTRKVILYTMVAWLTKEAGAALLNITIENIIRNEPEISEQDATRIAEKVLELLNKQVAIRPVQELFREVEKDQSISGVGVGTAKGARPSSLVPRDQFAKRGRDATDTTDSDQIRFRRERSILTLISPVLQDNKNKWRFQSKDGTIYAGMKDESFLRELLSGRSDIKMRSGIRLIADMEIKERLDNGVWTISERDVTRVLGIRTETEIDDLFSPS